MNCLHNLLHFLYSLFKKNKKRVQEKNSNARYWFQLLKVVEKIRSILSIQPTLNQHNTYRKQSIHLQCKSIEWFLYECNIGLIW